MKKRIIALILCVIMVTGMLPVTVFAAETDNLHHFTKRNDYTSGTFDDVQKDDWFYKNVKSVYELGLMQGKGGKQFDPESSVTIAETLTIAARLHSIYYTGSDAFTASNPWYQVYVDYCAANGIASVDSGAYSQPASRAEFVMILANALPAEVFGEVNQVADNAIPDVHIKDSYGAAVYKMYRAGIMIGNDGIGTFAPDSEIKRSEVAAIVTRMVDASLRESIQLGKEYIVTFNMNGHGKQVDPQAVVEGYTAEKPADPTNASYAFKGWYTQKSGGQQFDFNTPITEDITLYARWELNSGWTGDPGWDDDYIPTYTVTFDANGSDVENLPEVQRVKAGECAVEPDEPTKLIHDFGGWYTDSSCTNPFDFSTPITSNITLYAKWNITIYAKPIDESHVKTGVLECDGEEYEGMYIDNQLIVVSREGVGLEEIEALADLYGGHVVGQNSSVGMYQVEFAKTRTKEELEALAEDFLRGPVESAYLHRVYEMQNDAYYPNDLQDRYAEAPDAYENYEYCWNTFLWGHDACYVPEAWEVVLAETENPSVVMGLIDDSFDARHEDLNFFRCFMHKDQYNPFEVAASNPAAAEHGTHVAGIMGAVTNNGRGISGVALNASLIGVSVRDRDGNEGCLMGAMSWNNDISLLIENGAKVINISLGMKQTAINNVSVWLKAKALALDLKLTLDHHYKQGKDFLIVTSAGNDGQYNGDTNYNNAFCNISEEYLKDRIIVVGNAARLGSEYVRSESSSYLGGRVDVMAPGTGIGGGIYSTLPNNRYGGTKLNGELLIGTSMAAPFVAGLAGLIWEANPNLTPERVKEIIVSTANIDVADSDANMVNAEAAVIEALGYDPRTKDITFSFVDTSTDSAIKARLVSWKGVEYSPKYEFHPELDLNDLKLTYWVMNGDENSTISTVPYTVPYGEFKFEFEAPGYQKTTVAFSVDNDTDVITINMTPEGMVIPPVEPGFNITGTFVYWNDANKEIPVSFAKCMLTDVTNSNIIYFAEVADGKLSNESFSTKPPAGTYLFELEGGDKDANGFYSYKLIDTVAVTSDLDMGKVYCDRVADVNCWVTDEDGNALNRVSMTITQNGCEIVRIASFYGGFTIPLQKGTYMLTLTCDGYLPVEKEFTVNGTTDLGVIKMSTATVMTKTMHIRFVDSKSGAALKISDIFEDTSYIGIGHSGLSEGEEFIAGDFIDGGRGTNAFTVNDDKELVFGDVPVIEEMGNYYLIFDSVEKGYLFPNTYTIPSLDLVENAAGEWTAEIELEKVALIVGDVAVTSENALDILGDGTARYDAGSGVLTLTNANITADYVVSTNMDQLTVEIPSGTTTTLTIAPVDYRGHAAAIEARGDLSILGGGTLIIDGDKGVDAICGGYQYSNDEEYELSISDVTVKMPSNNTTGITANRGNLILRNATVLKTGEEDYGHLITGKSIDIIESKIEMISAGTKLIWSAGGDITIVDSVIKLDVDSTRNVYYSIFAEMGAISISGTSAIEIISEETDTSTDYEFLTATNGIQVEDGLLITGSDNVLCEIYQNSSLDSYSVRYKEEEERYPTMISVARSSW